MIKNNKIYFPVIIVLAILLIISISTISGIAKEKEYDKDGLDQVCIQGKITDIKEENNEKILTIEVGNKEQKVKVLYSTKLNDVSVSVNEYVLVHSEIPSFEDLDPYSYEFPAKLITNWDVKEK